MKYYWMAVTADEYELPIYVEDTCIALGKKVNKNPDVIRSAVNKGLSGKINKMKYVKVERDA